MKRKISLFLIIAVAVSVFSFQIKSDNPTDKNLRSKKQEMKLIDAGILNGNNEAMGPGINVPQTNINESFEGNTFPPAGWTKLSPDGGTGWNQQINGTTPVPGFQGGVITTPVGGGNKCAFESWNTGGAVSNDQWLITPQLTNVQSNDSLKFSLRYWPNSYRDSIEVKISTSTPVAANFTTLVFRKSFAVNSPDTNWVSYKFRIGNLVTVGSNIYIGFREVVADNLTDGATFSLDLVSTTGAAAFTNDIAASSIDAPINTALPTAPIAPKATFTNVGSANQTNIPVTFSITGPVNYSGSSSITTLNAGNSIQVTFPATFSPTAGTYNATAICNLGTDQNRSNDTARSSFTVIQPNYGGGGANSGGYYFANSTAGANPAPSKPSFCWIDTTGSISLVKNSVASVALTSGTLDDGYWALSGLGGPRKIRFMGVSYDSVFIGTNGIVAFTAFPPGGGNWNPPATGLPNPGPGGGVRPGFYPSWNDQDWGNTSAPINNRLCYRVDNDKKKLIITYDKSPLYAGVSGDFQTYQICLDFQADTANAPNSNILLNIDSSFNALNLPYLIGLQDGTGANYLQYTFINSSAVVVTPGPLFDGTEQGLSVAFGPNPANFGDCCKQLNLTAYIEGYWNGSIYKGDTLIVQIRSGISPYNVIESHKVKNDASGFVIVPVGIHNLTNYYISIQNRSAIETWSHLVQWNGQTLSYNMTTGASQAFGSNLVLKSGKYCIYSGDVNQDGVVDITDGQLIDNDAFNFVSGYVPTDVNYDDIVDIADAAIQDNNAFNFVGEILP
jgi:hypothetical protein